MAEPPSDPIWLAHRYDAAGDRIQFVHTPRERHRAIPFLIDEYLPGADAPRVFPRDAAVQLAGPAGPLHFIFHSAFCCSTLLVRALDREGVAMGLSEPTILNDIVGWRHRDRPAGPKAAMVLNQALGLLARAWGRGEAVIVKPSNLINPLAPAILGMRPQSRALLLHAPLKDYLASIARKGLYGRLWARDLAVKLLREGLIAPFNQTPEDLLKLTDLQVAAVGWLAQHRLFADLCARLGAGRVATLNSETLMNQPADVLAALAAHFALDLTTAAAAEIAAGPAFTRNSKTGAAFSAADRAADRDVGLAAHADEIEKVGIWASALAKVADVPIQLPLALIGR